LEGCGADREWLLSDGTGGYAMGTVSGLRTRRDHAFLITPGRQVALVALDPVVILPSGAHLELATHEWASGAIAPQGHLLLAAFDQTDGVPRWRWRIGAVAIERELAMTHGRPGVAIVHRILAAPEPVRLTLGALCTWRPTGTARTAGARPSVEQVADGAVIEGAYRLAGPGWRPGGEWYFGARTRQDTEPLEDLWYTGSFTAVLAPGAALAVCAWTGDLATPPPPATTTVAAARKRAGKLVTAAKPADDVDRQLALAADTFIVHTPQGPDVVASYPSPGPAARDTLTSYEGLFLETGRTAEGRELLQGYADGLTDDAALWYTHAVERHVARTGDSDLAATLLPTLDAIITAHLAGSGPGLTADPGDGLLVRAADATMLTWLDGRPGKPVDDNALWVNALGAVARLRECVGRDATDLHHTHEIARNAFTKRFRTPGGGLFDIVDAPPPPYPLAGSQPYDDPVLRPYQLLACALPYGPLEHADPAALHPVSASLLTPLGLRTLAPTEYGYQPGAEHQGAVWPWLIGPYAAACRAAGLPTAGLLDGLEAHLGEYGLGSVSELAFGEPPHRPTGAPFHARSVAELLRARRLLAPRPRRSRG
jgi:predicted glycogen debranching enzyme